MKSGQNINLHFRFINILEIIFKKTYDKYNVLSSAHQHSEEVPFLL